MHAIVVHYTMINVWDACQVHGLAIGVDATWKHEVGFSDMDALLKHCAPASAQAWRSCCPNSDALMTLQISHLRSAFDPTLLMSMGRTS